MNRIVLSVLLLLALSPLGTAPPARAAEPSGAAVAMRSDSATTPEAATEVASSTPRDYRAEARAAFTDDNRAYQRQRVTLMLWSPLVGVLAGLFLLFAGWSQRMRDFARARVPGRYGRRACSRCISPPWPAEPEAQHPFNLPTRQAKETSFTNRHVYVP